jgi:hypothetical protein
MAVRQETPPELMALAAKAKLDGQVAAWCRAEFRSGKRGAFAVAVSSGKKGGRYVALDSDGRATELGPYESAPDLSCYSRAKAEKLDESIKDSDTIHGEIRPRWKTTVVCGFSDDTTATCWQYSPTKRVFVTVGKWIT